jgi:putative transposase
MMKNIEFTPTNYPSDLTDKEWAIIESLFPRGNKSKWNKRSLVNAVLCIVKTGCQWGSLPHEYPPYATAWSFFRRARDNGLWENIMGALVKKTRTASGRNGNPAYAIIDSQSAKTVAAGEERGSGGGKKNKGA